MTIGNPIIESCAIWLPRERPTVIVIGAGSTRGASFVGSNRLAKPPLDGDFFLLLKSTFLTGDDRKDAERLLKFIEEEFGNGKVGMEAFYSQAYLHDRFVGEIPTGAKGRARRYQFALRYFRRLLPTVLGRTLEDQSCTYMGRLVEAIDTNDTFISFNYDCLLDRALREHGGRRWRPEIGYGFDVVDGADGWKNHAGMGRLPARGLTLLKPHGSLNWRRRHDGMS